MEGFRLKTGGAKWTSEHFGLRSLSLSSTSLGLGFRV